MFILIYPDGQFVKKNTIEEVSTMPGDKFLFHLGETYSINVENGIQFYENGKPSKFIHKNFELVDIKKISFSNVPFEYKFFDHQSNSIRVIRPKSNVFDYSFSSAIKDILAISQFNSWDDYQDFQKYLLLKQENETLKAQIITLQKEKEGLLVKSPES